MKLIDKDAVLAEIKEWLTEIEKLSHSKEADDEYGKGFCDGRRGAYRKFLSSINSLEVKEVDLDYIKKELDELIRFNKPDGNFGWGTLYNVATHFFELGLKAQKGE